jgi:hypothetical protein
MTIKKSKIFDPADGFAPIADALSLCDCSVVKRGNKWCMYLAGDAIGGEVPELFSASLPEDKALSSDGWEITCQSNNNKAIAVLAEHNKSKGWDLRGGRHCPSYVQGWNPQKKSWVERIYYAGARDKVWGPYTIGHLEWDGNEWVDQPAPAFEANEDWEHGSVYEPNLIYHDGKWKMWYVAGANHEGYIVHGYSESEDGQTNWSKHRIFLSAEEKVFDFCIKETKNGYEAVFSRIILDHNLPALPAGLWYCKAQYPSPQISGWSKPMQIMTAEDCGWHSGPWKPSFAYDDINPDKMFVFFNGMYKGKTEGPFPFVFTLGCLEIDWQE